MLRAVAAAALISAGKQKDYDALLLSLQSGDTARIFDPDFSSAAAYEPLYQKHQGLYRVSQAWYH